MILDRLYTPVDGELIYHYCRPEAFVEIMISQTMWLSAHYALNDATERKWGYSIFAETANQLQLVAGSAFTDRIRAIVDMAYSRSFLMVSSYSLDGDVLSQWRAYADDGRGMAIGFSSMQMRMAAKPLRVLYDKKLQITELLGNLKHTYEYEKSIGFKFGDDFQTHCFNIGLDLCAYKNPTFSEEREIRYAHISAIASDGSSKHIMATGARGPTGKRLSRPSKVHFLTSNGVIVPYVALDYSNRATMAPAKVIILGPKSKDTEHNISIFLNTIGLKGVAVQRSKIPYQ